MPTIEDYRTVLRESIHEDAPELPAENVEHCLHTYELALIEKHKDKLDTPILGEGYSELDFVKQLVAKREHLKTVYRDNHDRLTPQDRPV